LRDRLIMELGILADVQCRQMEAEHVQLVTQGTDCLFFDEMAAGSSEGMGQQV